MTNVQELRDIIRRLHGAEAKHVDSVPVKEEFQGKRFGKALSRYLT
jgi:hypothetical protein